MMSEQALKLRSREAKVDPCGCLLVLIIAATLGFEGRGLGRPWLVKNGGRLIWRLLRAREADWASVHA
jgi:hypothetical protein